MTCGRAHLLEPMVLGEVPHLQAELRAHAEHCSLCRHELRWLESERELFRQRAGRDEVAQLWKRFDRERVGRRRVAVFASIAAVLLLGLTAGRVLVMRGASHTSWSGEAVEESQEIVSLSDADTTVCSQLPPGLGFHCGPGVPASFIASR